MKLTKETLKRIIKEEMMQVMREMDSDPANEASPLGALQAALESDGRFKIEPDHRNPEAYLSKHPLIHGLLL